MRSDGLDLLALCEFQFKLVVLFIVIDKWLLEVAINGVDYEKDEAYAN